MQSNGELNRSHTGLAFSSKNTLKGVEYTIDEAKESDLSATGIFGNPAPNNGSE
jgi:hypothetical protein